MKSGFIYLEVLKYYYYSYKEIYSVLANKYWYGMKAKKKFNNTLLNDSFKKEIEVYLENTYREMTVLDFIFKNGYKLNCQDVYNFLDKIDDGFEKKYQYFEYLIDNIETAIDMNLEYKFYIPRKNYKDLSDEDMNNYISYVKGFNNDNVNSFLINEQVLDNSLLDLILKKTKWLDTDSYNNSDIFGVFGENFDKILLPIIKDQSSTLINIHELTHAALLNQDNREDIIYGEDLPIFYELLFKENNKFVTQNIHTTEESLELLSTYNNEPFEEQIKKLELIKR